MVFSSLIFLFLYLPLVLLAYYLIRPNYRNLFLTVVSLFFYFWGENWLVFIMIADALIDYVAGLVISGAIYRKNWGKPIEILEEGGKRTALQKAALVISLTGNLSILAYFKYFNFGVDNFNAFFSMLGMDNMLWKNAWHVALPLGVSFYTFNSMSYTIDVYRGHTKATRHIFDYLCFASLFPHLVAGPIIQYVVLAEQLVERTLSLEKFSYGIRRFAIGLAKKVLIANTMAVPADHIFGLPASDLTFGLSWLGVFCYSFQIYFDFSGYSDMAIGLARMFGFKFVENFNYPYYSQSIKEVWRRWHITLSTWFRDYLYIPLGGNRVSEFRIYLNQYIVFFLCGLWHGAAWNFIVWGLWHGTFLSLERAFLGDILEKIYRPFRHVYVVIVAGTGWVFFRAESLTYALTMIKAMCGLGAGDGIKYYPSLYMDEKLIFMLIVATIGSVPFVTNKVNELKERIFANNNLLGITAQVGFSCIELVVVAGFLLSSAMLLSSGTHNPFIYFRF